MITFEQHTAHIKAELAYAKAKHPEFAPVLTNSSNDSWNFLEKHQKKINDSKTISERTADGILMEEISEAFNAATAGEKEHAILEFYQVCAVALRCIEFIEEKGVNNANS